MNMNKIVNRTTLFLLVAGGVLLGISLYQVLKKDICKFKIKSYPNKDLIEIASLTLKEGRFAEHSIVIGNHAKVVIEELPCDYKVKDTIDNNPTKVIIEWIK